MEASVPALSLGEKLEKSEGTEEIKLDGENVYTPALFGEQHGLYIS